MRRGAFFHRAYLTYDPRLWRPESRRYKSEGRWLASTGAGSLEKKAVFAFSFKTEATREATAWSLDDNKSESRHEERLLRVKAKRYEHIIALAVTKKGFCE